MSEPAPEFPPSLWVHRYQTQATGDEWLWAADEYRSSIIRQVEYVRVPPIPERRDQ